MRAPRESRQASRRNSRPPTRADVVIDAVAHAKASSNGGASARRRGDGALVSAEWLYDSVSDCERKPVAVWARIRSDMRPDVPMVSCRLIGS